MKIGLTFQSYNWKQGRWSSLLCNVSEMAFFHDTLVAFTDFWVYGFICDLLHVQEKHSPHKFYHCFWRAGFPTDLRGWNFSAASPHKGLYSVLKVLIYTKCCVIWLHPPTPASWTKAMAQQWHLLMHRWPQNQDRNKPSSSLRSQVRAYRVKVNPAAKVLEHVSLLASLRVDCSVKAMQIPWFIFGPSRLMAKQWHVENHSFFMTGV